MSENMYAEVLRLRGLTVGALRDRYTEVFGDAPRSHHGQENLGVTSSQRPRMVAQVGPLLFCRRVARFRSRG